MHKLAIISDIHANLPALTAVLNDIDERRADVVFCLGDLVDFCPWPNEVIEVVRQRRIPTLMGNHDERIAFDHEIIPLQKHSSEERTARVLAIEHTRKVISNENKKYLAELPRSIQLTFGTKRNTKHILFVHASTLSNDEYIYEDHPEEDLQRMIRKSDTDILVMGHTHIPYIRSLPGGKFALNAGSVGRSKEDTASAAYLMLSFTDSHFHPEIVRVDFPVEATIAGLRMSAIPAFYVDFWRGKKNG